MFEHILYQFLRVTFCFISYAIVQILFICRLQTLTFWILFLFFWAWTRQLLWNKNASELYKDMFNKCWKFYLYKHTPHICINDRYLNLGTTRYPIFNIHLHFIIKHRSFFCCCLKEKTDYFVCYPKYINYNETKKKNQHIFRK